MKSLVLYAHPNPASFNHAILERLEARFRREGREYAVRDLYAMGFRPALEGKDFVAFQQGTVPADIREEQELLRNADLLIVLHPIWWFGMPAVLKGYIDRVFSKGFAYDFDERGVRGLLPGKKVAILNTTGGPEEAYRDHGFAAGIRQTIDIGTFGLCGMEVVLHHYFYAVPAVTPEARAKMLAEIESLPL